MCTHNAVQRDTSPQSQGIIDSSTAYLAMSPSEVVFEARNELQQEELLSMTHAPGTCYKTLQLRDGSRCTYRKK